MTEVYNLRRTLYLFWISNILSFVTLNAKGMPLLISNNQWFFSLFSYFNWTPNMPVSYDILWENRTLISITEVVAKINNSINAFLCRKILKWLYHTLCFFYFGTGIEEAVKSKSSQ